MAPPENRSRKMGSSAECDPRSARKSPQPGALNHRRCPLPGALSFFLIKSSDFFSRRPKRQWRNPFRRKSALNAADAAFFALFITRSKRCRKRVDNNRKRPACLQPCCRYAGEALLTTAEGNRCATGTGPLPLDNGLMMRSRMNRCIAMNVTKRSEAKHGRKKRKQTHRKRPAPTAHVHQL